MEYPPCRDCDAEQHVDELTSAYHARHDPPVDDDDEDGDDDGAGRVNWTLDMEIKLANAKKEEDQRLVTEKIFRAVTRERRWVLIVAKMREKKTLYPTL